MHSAAADLAMQIIGRAALTQDDIEPDLEWMLQFAA